MYRLREKRIGARWKTLHKGTWESCAKFMKEKYESIVRFSSHDILAFGTDRIILRDRELRIFKED